MPSYYFHLTFELYSNPLTTGQTEQEIFLPPATTDIFKTPLPFHGHPGWWPEASAKKRSRKSKAAASSGTLSSPKDDSSTSPDLTVRGSASRTSQDRLAGQPTEQSSSFNDKSPLVPKSVGHLPRDWRFGPVSIESIDMTTPDPKAIVERVRGKSVSYSGLGAGAGGIATKGRFVPSDPQNTEVGWGVVHLYRDGEETPGLYETLEDRLSSRPCSESEQVGTAVNSGQSTVASEDCTTLCILAVPSYLTPSDFLGFVGEQTREEVSHFRMIRSGRINRYMVLMKFRETSAAKEWRKEWNGKAFNSMEPENCQVVFVKSIQFQTSDLTSDQPSFPDMTHDPFTPRPSNAIVAALPTAPPSTTSSGPLPTAPLSTKPLAPPTPSLIELPTCPVCLERMDETTGLLTILCQHVFHCTCLQKWKGSGCPVCRYTQGDSFGLGKGGFGMGDDGTENVCTICGSESNLWVCLICGNVGCGRYDEAHAFSHYQETSHCYAMDIDSQRVWDYAGDGYVHRLIQNQSDGKLVELPSALAKSRGGGGGNSDYTGLGGEYVPRDKLDNIGMEYTYLLTSQLDSQRLYFEEKVTQAADKASKAAHGAELAAESAVRTMRQLEELKRDYDLVIKEIVPGLERDKLRAERKAEKLGETARKMEKEWREEKAMNESLMERIDFMEKELKELKEQKDDLQEQNRDLSFFISGQAKLQEAGEEVKEGTITVGDAPKVGGKKGKGKGKR